MNICIITPDYSDDKVVIYPFVEQLAVEMARQGHQVCIVAPYWLNRRKRFYRYREVTQYGNGKLIVLRPHFFTLSKLKFGKISVSEYLKHRAVNYSLHRLPFVPDFIYGHFWESGWAGYKYAKTQNLPLFVACGESNLEIAFPKELRHQGMVDYISGVICVSTKAKNDTVRLGFAKEEQCRVFPNAINNSLFYKRNKAECRKRLNLPLDKFIVAFVGWFIDRKGSNRLSEALDLIDSGDVYSVFVGSNVDNSDYEPTCKRILFKGSVPHNQVPEYLCAADIFVLPTLNEGCSNAVVEAMACGLPIVSSNLSFNWDVLDNTNSIMIDPHSVNDIKESIIRLRENKELRNRLSEGALNKAHELSLDKRVERILSFIKETIINQ